MTEAPLFDCTGVELHGGVVQSATITDERGTRPDMTNVGKFLYYVDAVEADGCRVGMWHGDSREKALDEAAILARDFGVPLHDLTRAQA